MWAKYKNEATDCNIGHILLNSCHFANILQTGYCWRNNIILFQQNTFLYLFWREKYIIRFLNNLKGKNITTT